MGNNNGRKRKKKSQVEEEDEENRHNKEEERQEQQNNDIALAPTRNELSRLLCMIVDVKTTTITSTSRSCTNEYERGKYSREDSLRALQKLHRWSFEGDGKFLECLYLNTGVYMMCNLLDFMSIVLNDDNDDDNYNINDPTDDDEKIIRDNQNCIKYVSSIIGCICYQGDDDANKKIAIKMSSTLLHVYCNDENKKYNGLEILLRFNEQFNPSLISVGKKNKNNNDDESSSLELKTIQEIWHALRNMTSFNDKKTILLSKKQAVTVFHSGIRMIKKLTIINNSGRWTADTINHNNMITVSDILYEILGTFKNIVLDNLMTKKQFHDLNIVSKCLQIFQQQKVVTSTTAIVPTKKKRKKKSKMQRKEVSNNNGDDVVWNTHNGDEALTESALDFFDGCRHKNLLSFTGSTNNYDCENFLPLCAITLHEFGSTNDIILNAAINLLKAVIKSKTLPLSKIEHYGVRE